MSDTQTITRTEAERVLEVLGRLGGEATRSRLADRAKTKDIPRERVLEVIDVMVDNVDLHIDGARVTVADHDEEVTTEPVITLSKRGKGGGSVWVLVDGVRVGYAVQQENGSWVAYDLEDTFVGTESPTRKAAGAFLV